MTVHEMLQQVALFSSGRYSRDGDVSSIDIPLPGGRRQVISGKIERMRGEPMGVLYTTVGELTDDVDLAHLLELNAALRYAKITIMQRSYVVLVALFDLDETSIKECAPMLQEMAAVADDLERQYYGEDRE